MGEGSFDFAAAASLEGEGVEESSSEELKDLLNELTAEGDEDVYYKAVEEFEEGRHIDAITTLEQIVKGWGESERKNYIETRIADLKVAFNIEE